MRSLPRRKRVSQAFWLFRTSAESETDQDVEQLVIRTCRIFATHAGAAVTGWSTSQTCNWRLTSRSEEPARAGGGVLRRRCRLAHTGRFRSASAQNVSHGEDHCQQQYPDKKAAEQLLIAHYQFELAGFLVSRSEEHTSE